MNLPNILRFTPEELRKHFAEHNIEAYRADQILKWIYEKGVYDFDRMTDLGVPLRQQLKKMYVLEMPKIVEKEKSDDDKSTKLLLQLPGKDLVECVHMPLETRLTVCISSQVGCKFHCAFCASGQAGFFRNLKMDEIISQVLMARDLSPEKRITNIVFMGIGEPLDNYKEVLKAVRTLNAKQGMGIGARKITISTCGLIPKIEELSNEELQVELSVSLHGTNDMVRGTIMPVNKAYPLYPLIDACKRYVKKTKRAITFEYILVKGVNSSERDARDLVKLIGGMLCKVNLIPYNSIAEFPHEQPSYKEIVRFQKILDHAGIRTTVRFSKGRDISAACGQLRSVKIKG